MCSIPLLTGWYSQKKTQNVLATYEQVVEQTTGDEIEQLRNQADEYNKKLWAESKGVREQSESEQMEEYEGLLNAEKIQTGMMCVLEIPSIDLRLPVYHGTSEAVLKEGVGHLMDSSLPIGGENTHCGHHFHIMFMPCSDEFKYIQRFKRLNWYVCTHCPDLTSGLYDVDVFEPRECLHEAKGYENRILERNYRITGDIKGKDVIIVDDVLTTGQSMTDYKEEIERCGGKVVAAIFYGKTITLPHPLIVKLEVWGDYITRFSKSN